jgi:hypothetical protein
MSLAIKILLETISYGLYLTKCKQIYLWLAVIYILAKYSLKFSGKFEKHDYK